MVGEILILTLLTTTSVQDCGLLDKILPGFEKKFQCQVRVVAVGSGAAFRLGKDGQGDILLVHEPEGEQNFIREGYSTRRYPVMSNEFILVGPEEKEFKEKSDLIKILREICDSRWKFVSRGDNSGTHQRELDLWKKAGIKPKDSCYLETGQGMIETLRVANEKGALALTDNATFFRHQNELQDLKVYYARGQELINQYSLIPVSPERFPKANHKLALKLVDYFLSSEVQNYIKTFGSEWGHQFFKPAVK